MTSLSRTGLEVLASAAGLLIVELAADNDAMLVDKRVKFDRLLKVAVRHWTEIGAADDEDELPREQVQ
jgi:hypothetical protein